MFISSNCITNVRYVQYTYIIEITRVNRVGNWETGKLTFLAGNEKTIFKELLTADLTTACVQCMYLNCCFKAKVTLCL